MVYLDNAATTRISEEVLEAMLPFLKEEYGNPSSIYNFSRAARLAIEQAREKTAAAIKADKSEIFFTSGGTEADNWALKSVARAMAGSGKKHIITSAFEHYAVLHSAQALEKEGFDLTYLPVGKEGVVTAEKVDDAIRPDTGLVSVMYVNNELGTLMPIDEIGLVCRENGIIFHTDAVQAAGNVEIDVESQNIDLLSLSAHKINGPKGTGALYCRSGVNLAPLIHGGAQERGKRAGTENVAGIAGFGRAIEIAAANIREKNKKLAPLHDKILAEVLKLPRTYLNGDKEKRVPSIMNFTFEGIEGESLLLMLDIQGICASAGSACSSGSLSPSHVLTALGMDEDIAHGSLRVSLGAYNTEDDVNALAAALPKIVNQLRVISPLWREINRR